jgi:tRNA(Ile)-lysidine synthase
MMLEKFKTFIQTSCLTNKDQRIIIGVSGGADSMSLLNLLYDSGFKIAVAHCNFMLRGAESDEDELFVKLATEKLNVPFFVKHFNTLEYAKLQKVNIQMAARELRYNWFDNLRRLNNYDKVAIAHNADDTIETFFINLIRGTGIQGISGIKPINNFVIRPLLFAFRSDIEDYCRQKNIEYRTDSSNLSDKYLRNKLRNSILPFFSNAKSEFKNIMLKNIENFEQAEKIYTSYIEQVKNSLITVKKDDEILINIEGIDNTISPSSVLIEILKEYNFSVRTIEEIHSTFHSDPGKIFLSKNYKLTKDRKHLIICKLKDVVEEKFHIFENTTEMDSPIKMSIRQFENKEYEIKRNPYLAALDYENLTFPLVLRKWQAGDYFQPLGMKGLKKLSNFFIDNKISLPQKENTWLLTSANEIVWVVGMRIDERFKVKKETSRVLEIEI